MRYYDCLLNDFLHMSKITDKFESELRKIGEDPNWYLQNLGNHRQVLEMAFDWNETTDGELYWEITNEMYLFFLEEQGHTSFLELSPEANVYEITIK